MRVITLGTFDLVHLGHINLLKRCRDIALWEKVVVGLNTDEFIEKYKGKRPIMSYLERKETILSTGLADVVIPNDQPKGSAKQVIQDSGAQLIVIGSDWAVKDYVGQLGINWGWLERNNIGIAYFPRTKGISTTELKKRIKE